MKGLARNTSQLLFCNRDRQNKHFSGSAQRRHGSVRLRSSTLGLLPAPLGSSMPSSRRATVRFPKIRPTKIEL
jgi:hypothetical protein